MAFVDTSFWIALRHERDAHHEAAKELLRRLEGTNLVTSNHVRGEAWTWLGRRAGHRAAVRFLDQIRRSKRISVVHVGEDLEEVALAWLRRYDDRAYSFVDATSFALMKALRIRDALAFDGDFTAAGFRELRP